MSVRVKTKRRLTFVVLFCALLFVLAAVAYLQRSRQISRRLAVVRAEGAAALEAGNYEVALHKIGSYVQRYGSDADALYEYAQAREKVPEPNSRHIGQSIALYRQFLSLRPTHLEARRRLLTLYVEFGFNQEAIETAVAIDPTAATPGASSDPDVLRAQATALARLRRYDDAYKAAQAYNEKAPRDLDAQRMTIEILLAQGKPATEAVDRASALQKRWPDDALFELLLGIAYRMAGDVKGAEQWVAQAASRASDHDPAFIGALVEHLESLERFDDSLRVLERSAGRGAAENKRLLAARLWQAKRYQDLIDRLGDLDPADKASDSELLALRAMALLELRRDDEARPLVAALEKRFDAKAEAWAPVLKTAFAREAVPPREVIRVCADAVARVRTNPYFHYFLANAYNGAGEQDRALFHWAQAGRLSPAWAAPWVKVARLLASAERPAEAATLVAAARRRSSHDVDVLRASSDILSLALSTADSSGVEASRAQNLTALRDTLAQLDASYPAEGSAAVARVVLFAAGGDRDGAVRSAHAALDASKVYDDDVYLRLAAVSKAFSLGVEVLSLSRCEAAHGRVTPSLAAARAHAALTAGSAAEGKRILDAARIGVRGPAESKAWRTAWVTYLDTTGDPAAKEEWMSFADALADDAAVQSLALRAPAVQGEREFLNRTIDRLRAATVENGIGWRIARARWLSKDVSGTNTLALTRAASLLGEVCRDMPDLPEPRMLLARCLADLGSPREAIHQLTRVVSVAPELGAARLELAGLLQAQGDHAGAKDQLDLVADDDAASHRDRAVAATLLARGGDTDKALTLLEQLGRAGARAGGGQPIPIVLMADLYYRQGDPRRAKDLCVRVLEKSADPGAIGLLADILSAEGQVPQAEQVLSRLDQATLPPPQKELVRGRYYALSGNRAKSLEQFDAATRVAPSSAAAWRTLTKFHLSGGDLASALAAAAASGASVHEAGLQALQRASLALPSGPEAKDLLPLLAGVVDAPADELAVVEMLKALAEVNRSSPETVLPRVRAIANRNPRVLVVQNAAARAFVLLGGRSGAEEGLTIATRTMQYFPGAAEPAETAATVLAALGRWDEATGYAQQWKRRSPPAPAADLIIASAHLALRRPQEALAVLQPYAAKVAGPQADVETEKPIVTQATILFARALIQTGKTGDAEALLAGRIRHSPQYRAAWIGIASRHHPDPVAAARWLDLARENAGSAFAEQASLAEAWLALAARSGAAAHAERAAEFVRVLTAATESDSASSVQLVAVGTLSEATGNPAAAEAAYRHALRINPDDPIAMNNLAMILAARGQTADAEKLAARAATLDHPRRASFYDTLATVQAQSRRWSEAGESIRKALDLDPMNVGFQIHRAVILSSNGDAAGAREALDAVGGIRLEDPSLSHIDRERLKTLRQRASIDE